MFEQSMLPNAAPGKSAGALAISLTIQAVGIGTLLLIPLIYTNRLRFMPLTLPTFLPLTPAPLPEATKTRPPSDPGHRSLLPQRPVFVPNFPNLSLAKGPDPSPLIGEVPPNLSDGPLLPAINIANVSVIPHIDVAPPPPLPPIVKPVPPAAPVRMTSEMVSAKNIRKILPIYPRLAVVTRVSGTVRLMGIIAKDGTIQQLQVVSGHPLLVQAAVDAVRQWLYSPTVLNGQPVEVIAPIDVVFTLAQ
jgi:protein TonB